MADDKFNLATLWVPVVPDMSEVAPALKKGGEDAKKQFQEGTKNIGDTVAKDLETAAKKTSENFTKTGEHINDVLSKTAEKSAEGFADAGKRAADNFDDSFDAQTSGAMGRVASKLGDKFGSLLGSTISTGVSKIDTVAQKVGIDLSQWLKPLQDAQGNFQNVKDTFTIFSNDIFKDGPGIIGMFGRMAASAAEIAGPLAAAAAAGKALADISDKIPFVHDRFHDESGAPKSSIERWLDQHAGPAMRFLVPSDFNDDGTPKTPQTPTAIRPPTIGPYGSGPAGGLPRGSISRSGVGTSADPNAIQPDIPNFYKDWYGSGSTTPSDGSTVPTAPSQGAASTPSVSNSRINTGGITSGVNNRAGVAKAGSRIANLYALANALQGTPYSQSLRNDCSGMVSQLASVAAGLPDPSPGERFTTVNEGQELAKMGFLPGIGPPGSLRVGWYDHGGGNAGHTAMTLPGGEHAESGGSHGNFIVGPGAAGADNPEFTNHAWLPMDGKPPRFMTGGDGGSGGGSFGAAPSGRQDDPIYVINAGSGPGSAGGAPGADGETTDLNGQGKQLANGVAQELGLDGSVFKTFGGSSSPLNFGATKMVTGLMNGLTGMLHGAGNDGATLGGGAGMGIPSISGLMPGSGTSVSSGVIPIGPGGAQNVRSGDTITNNHFHGDVNPLNVTQNGVKSPTEDLQHSQNAAANRTPALTANLPK